MLRDTHGLQVSSALLLMCVGDCIESLEIVVRVGLQQNTDDMIGGPNHTIFCVQDDPPLAQFVYNNDLS